MARMLRLIPVVDSVGWMVIRVRDQMKDRLIMDTDIILCIYNMYLPGCTVYIDICCPQIIHSRIVRVNVLCHANANHWKFLITDHRKGRIERARISGGVSHFEIKKNEN